MTDLQSFTLMMASAQVVETSVNTNSSSSQDYTTNLDNHSNHNIDSPGFKPFTVISMGTGLYLRLYSQDDFDPDFFKTKDS